MNQKIDELQHLLKRWNEGVLTPIVGAFRCALIISPDNVNEVMKSMPSEIKAVLRKSYLDCDTNPGVIVMAEGSEEAIAQARVQFAKMAPLLRRWFAMNELRDNESA